MPPDLAALAFVHLLVFVYWLGGDLGAFVAASVVTDAERPPAARSAAAHVLAQVDMGPRTALILAAPTGLSLAAAKGFVTLEQVPLAAVWTVSLGWLALAWLIHLRHVPPKHPLRIADLALRWSALAGLVAAALLWGELPGHLRIKVALLAAAIGLGLCIRALLAPFGPAFAQILQSGSTPEREAAVAGSLGRARLAVVALWIAIASAAFLGVSGGAAWTS